MTPADCFAVLWRETQRELARASGRPENVGRTVAYEAVCSVGVEAGIYIWRSGRFPTIRIYRSSDMPDDVELPDLKIRPVEDACTLAHERGHFISDPDGKRSQAAYTSLRNRDALTIRAKTTIIDEERRAWANGRDVLKALGCDDWSAFNAIEAECLRGYEEGLAGRPTGPA